MKIYTFYFPYEILSFNFNNLCKGPLDLGFG